MVLADFQALVATLGLAEFLDIAVTRALVVIVALAFQDILVLVEYLVIVAGLELADIQVQEYLVIQAIAAQ